MSTTFTHLETMSTQNCCKCGVLFAIPDDMDRRLRDNHETFYCPSGHSQHYTGITEAEKLRRQLANKEQELEMARKRRDEAQAEAEHFRKSRDGMKGALRKVSVRVKNGVCPCCKRTFCNLADHMAQKHPGFACEKVEP